MTLWFCLKLYSWRLGDSALLHKDVIYLTQQFADGETLYFIHTCHIHYERAVTRFLLALIAEKWPQYICWDWSIPVTRPLLELRVKIFGLKLCSCFGTKPRWTSEKLPEVVNYVAHFILWGAGLCTSDSVWGQAENKRCTSWTSHRTNISRILVITQQSSSSGVKSCSLNSTSSASTLVITFTPSYCKERNENNLKQLKSCFQCFITETRNGFIVCLLVSSRTNLGQMVLVFVERVPDGDGYRMWRQVKSSRSSKRLKNFFEHTVSTEQIETSQKKKGQRST